jgi:hypothetical protein
MLEGRGLEHFPVTSWTSFEVTSTIWRQWLDHVRTMFVHLSYHVCVHKHQDEDTPFLGSVRVDSLPKIKITQTRTHIILPRPLESSKPCILLGCTPSIPKYKAPKLSQNSISSKFDQVYTKKHEHLKSHLSW